MQAGKASNEEDEKSGGHYGDGLRWPNNSILAATLRCLEAGEQLAGR